MSASEQLDELMVSVMRGSRPMTDKQIVKALQGRAKIKTDARSVRMILMSRPGRFGQVRPRFQIFRRSVRWRLVEAGPAINPGSAGAPVPAWPYRPHLSGAAAAPLTFRNDEPPANAVGRSV
jgi:hypothetical protein